MMHRMTPHTTDSADREQVLTWLAGRLRFEQLLTDLHSGPEDQRGAEVGETVLAAELDEPAAAQAA